MVFKPNVFQGVFSVVVVVVAVWDEPEGVARIVGDGYVLGGEPLGGRVDGGDGVHPTNGGDEDG